jgi:hypothetical protein
MSAWIRRRLGADESGYVLMVVLLLAVIGLAIVFASLAAAISANSQAGRDARTRRAQGAADAGIQAVLYAASEEDLGSAAYNLNGGVIGLSNFLDCTPVQLNAQLQITGIVNTYANAAGVCPQAVSSGGSTTTLTQPVGDGTSYQSEMITGQTNLLNGTTINTQNGSAERELMPKIVSIGKEVTNTPVAATTVYSREEAILAPIAPLQAIEGENSVTIGGLKLLGVPVTGTLNGDVLSRGNLTTPSTFAGLNLSNGLIATLAYGGTLSGGLVIANAQHVTPSTIIQRPAVSISASKPNCSLASNCAALGTDYNSSYDTFSITSGSVTFAPGDYVFCSFNATGGSITANPSANGPVRIYIDSPSSSRCAADKAHGDGQIGNFYDTVGFSNGLLGTGGVLAASGVQVYVVGDGSYDGDTTVQIGPTSTGGLLSLSALTYGAIVYAPTSKVTVNVPALCVISCNLISSGGVFEGAVIGYDTTVNALLITQDLDIGNYPLYAGINAFRVTQYIQCDNSVTSLTGTTSDLGGC